MDVTITLPPPPPPPPIMENRLLNPNRGSISPISFIWNLILFCIISVIPLPFPSSCAAPPPSSSLNSHPSISALPSVSEINAWCKSGNNSQARPTGFLSFSSSHSHCTLPFLCKFLSAHSHLDVYCDLKLNFLLAIFYFFIFLSQAYGGTEPGRISKHSHHLKHSHCCQH